MAASAISRRLRPVLLSHYVLNPLENRIHGSVAVRAGLPFLIDFGVATAGAAGFGSGNRVRIEGAIGRGVRQTRGKRTVPAESVVIVGGKLVAIFRSRIGKRRSRNYAQSDYGRHQTRAQ